MSNKPKLEAKHLVPFVLHELNMWTGSMVCKLVLYKAQPEYKHGVMIYEAINCGVLPILRPLSDLTLEDCMANDISNAMSVLCGQSSEYILKHTSYKDIQTLISLHFDIDNLIPQGLAIDINTINLQDGTRKN